MSFNPGEKEKTLLALAAILHRTEEHHLFTTIYTISGCHPNYLPQLLLRVHRLGGQVRVEGVVTNTTDDFPNLLECIVQGFHPLGSGTVPFPEQDHEHNFL